jgi:Protein of unknown function (DUF2905)
MNSGAKFLIGVGLGLVIVGLIFALGGKAPILGKLPGDISVEREKFSFYFPLTSSLIVSAIFSLVMVVLGWFKGR